MAFLGGAAVEQPPSADLLSFASAMARCHTPGAGIALIDATGTAGGGIHCGQ